MKKVLVFFGLIVSCNLVVASSLDGFDGKKWGTSVNAIVKERGDPKLVFKSSDLWVWDVTEPETLGGYQIETIHYHFKNCAKVGYFVDEMWGGKYILSEPSDQLFNEISPKLVSRYGDVTQQSTSKMIRTNMYPTFSFWMTVAKLNSLTVRLFKFHENQ